ncbi:MAG: hypothetical protein ABI670_04685 [Chloroflexota bacterium]
MGDYFNRGASTGGHDEGYFNRDDITGPSGVGSETGGPGGVSSTDNTVYGKEHPELVRPLVETANRRPDETAGTTLNTYPDIVEGSDSERTGTSWGLVADPTADLVNTPDGLKTEGESKDQAHPNRNTGDRLTHDDLSDVGAWGTMDKNNSSAGSPTGNS